MKNIKQKRLKRFIERQEYLVRIKYITPAVAQDRINKVFWMLKENTNNFGG